MSKVTSILIAGGGLAGVSAARTLRELGYDGHIALVEPDLVPYDRPPLSKGFLDGSVAEDSLLLASEQWYDDNKVELVPAHVTALDPATGEVILSTGTRRPADRVVLALGGQPRSLDIPGADLPGVITLRTLADATRLRTGLRPCAHLAIIGAGLIGAEVASSASALGAHVTLIDPAELPLIHAVGTDIAARLHQMHIDAGITVLRDAPTAIHNHGAAYRIDMASGQSLDADLVLSAVGIAPQQSLADTARLDFDGGILVDHHQVTSNPAILAVGDIARVRFPDGTLRRRTEHWESAMQSGQRASRALLGIDPGPQTSTWFWSDRHGVHLEAFGDMNEPGRMIVREAPGEGITVFNVDTRGRIRGAAAIDGGSTIRVARKIVERERVVDLSALADPETNLRALAR